MPKFLLLLSCLWATLAQPASAQPPLPPGSRIGVILPPASTSTDGKAPASKPLIRDAMAAVGNGLRMYGHEVVPHAQIVLMLLDEDTDCKAHSCPAEEILKVLDINAVALVAVWDDRTPADITIQITLPNAVGEARGRLVGDLNRVVHSILSEALASVKNGHPVPLRVDANPRTASITLDGIHIDEGAVVDVHPGHHSVTLTDPDLGSMSRGIDVPRGQVTTFVVSMVMPGAEADNWSGQLQPRRKSTPLWDYAAGGALAALGVALAITPVQALLNDGGPKDPTIAGTREHMAFDGTTDSIQLATALVALCGSAWFIAGTPIQASLSANGDMVHAQVSGSF